jgi:hypothetical protein
VDIKRGRIKGGEIFVVAIKDSRLSATERDPVLKSQNLRLDSMGKKIQKTR